MTAPPFVSADVAAVFDAAPEPQRTHLLELRHLIFQRADELDGVGEVRESLKWGQPSYAPSPKTGTPVRLGVSKNGALSTFVHCQSPVIATLESPAPDGITIEGTRAMHLTQISPETAAYVAAFIDHAFTYRLTHQS